MTSNGIVQKLWNYCNVLRDDGLSYGDYVEQLTYLLFLKMADEQTRPPFNRSAIIPKDLDLSAPACYAWTATNWLRHRFRQGWCKAFGGHGRCREENSDDRYCLVTNCCRILGDFCRCLFGRNGFWLGR